MYLLDVDMAELIGKATAPVAKCVNLVLEESLLKDFADVFKEELGLIEVKITVDPAATPKFHCHRPVVFALKEKVKLLLNAQVSEELIPVEQSEWVAPIVVVNKKDRGIRICGDFKVSIDPVVCSQVHPLPTPEEMFSTLANGESYSKLDLANAYKLMRASDCSQPQLTINTHIGLFHYSRLPFGISTAPAIWQKAMAQVLNGIPGVVYFIDDILVTGSSRAEHGANLYKVLTRIREYGLCLNKAKCVFFKKSLNVWVIAFQMRGSNQPQVG